MSFSKTRLKKKMESARRWLDSELKAGKQDWLLQLAEGGVVRPWESGCDAFLMNSFERLYVLFEWAVSQEDASHRDMSLTVHRLPHRITDTQRAELGRMVARAFHPTNPLGR